MDSKNYNRPYFLALCCLIVVQLFFANQLDATRGLCTDGDECMVPKLEKQSDLYQMDLLKRCVERKSVSSVQLHKALVEHSVLEGLVQFMRIELGAVYVNDYEANRETYEQAYREKLFEPCKRVRGSASQWLRGKKSKSEMVKDWMTVVNICKMVIEKESDLIGKSYSKFAEQLVNDRRVQLGQLENFSRSVNFALVATCASDDRTFVHIKENLIKYIEQKEGEEKRVDYDPFAVGRRPPPETPYSKRLRSSIAEGALPRAIAGAIREYKLEAKGAPKAMFAQNYQKYVVRSCEYVHKVLDKWWERYNKQDEVSIDDSYWLISENICRNVMANPDRMLEDAYAEYSQMN